jgi:hypothetical protein
VKATELDIGSMEYKSYQPPPPTINDGVPEQLSAANTDDAIYFRSCTPPPLRTCVPHDAQTHADGAPTPSYRRCCGGCGCGGYASPHDSYSTLADLRTPFSMPHHLRTLAPDGGAPRLERGGTLLWSAGTTPYAALAAF